MKFHLILIALLFFLVEGSVGQLSLSTQMIIPTDQDQYKGPGVLLSSEVYIPISDHVACGIDLSVGYFTRKQSSVQGYKMLIAGAYAKVKIINKPVAWIGGEYLQGTSMFTTKLNMFGTNTTIDSNKSIFYNYYLSVFGEYFINHNVYLKLSYFSPLLSSIYEAPFYSNLVSIGVGIEPFHLGSLFGKGKGGSTEKVETAN